MASLGSTLGSSKQTGEITVRMLRPLAALIGALLSVPLAAHADVSFTWGATSEEWATKTYNYIQGGPPYDVVTTGGLKGVNSGAVSASVNAWGDPTQGVFKAVTRATTGADGAYDIAESYARLDITDTIRLSGPGQTTTLTITLDYDTVISGLGIDRGLTPDRGQRFQQVNSSRAVFLSYDKANPAFDPTATCIDYGADGVWCPPEAQPTLTVRGEEGHAQFREWAVGGPDGIYTNGDAVNGRDSGQVVLSLEVPTETDISLVFQLYNGSRCFHLPSCSVTSDATHSDYLGISLAEGYSFTSSSGYRYLGLAAAVPEPSSWALTLVGLAAVGLLSRQRTRNRQGQGG